jgi:hypothetical protein
MTLKTIFLLFILWNITSCSEINDSNQFENSSSKRIKSEPTSYIHKPLTSKKYCNKQLDKIVQSIWNSDKVQKRDKEIRKLSGNTRNLSILEIDSDDEINIKLVEDNGLSLVTHLMFIVEPNDQWKIYYYEPITDQQIDFDLWLAQKD